jgi:hypothetical protein
MQPKPGSRDNRRIASDRIGPFKEEAVKNVLRIVLLGLVAGLGGSAWSQAYPARSIVLVVPF